MFLSALAEGDAILRQKLQGRGQNRERVMAFHTINRPLGGNKRNY